MKQLLTKARTYFDKEFFTYFAAGALSVSLLAGGVATLQQPAEAAPAPAAPAVGCDGLYPRKNAASSPTDDFGARVLLEFSAVKQTSKVEVRVKNSNNKTVHTESYTIKANHQKVIQWTAKQGKYTISYRLDGGDWNDVSLNKFRTDPSNIVMDCLDPKYPYDLMIEHVHRYRVMDAKNNFTGNYIRYDKNGSVIAE